MIYLIVQPIIIIIAVAILIVFLTRVLSSEKGSKSSTVSKNNVKNNIINNQRLKLQNRVSAMVTQGIVTGKNVEKIVSLRKKNMISDKIQDGEDRDAQELGLMKEIESNPQDSKKYEELGDYYMEHERFEDAQECYKYVLRLNPRHKRAQVAMKNLDRVI